MNTEINNQQTVSWVRQGLVLGAFILLCYSAALIGALFTTPSIGNWYSELPKPSWTPPNWVFPVVWNTLYLLIAISGWLLWRHRHHTRAWSALVLFGIQLILNVLWSLIFFTFHAPLLALYELVVLWVVILLLVIYSFRVSWWAGILLLPYLLWVTFAGFLNFAIVSQLME